MSEYKTTPIPIATNGLNKDLQPTQIPSASPNLVNMVVENWGVRKRLGYTLAGINLPLPGIGMELIQYMDAVGDIHQIACTSTSIYQYDSDSNQWLNIGAATTIEDCEDAWVSGAGSDSAVTESTIKKVGSNSAKITAIADASVGDLMAYEDFASSIDITTHNMFTFWVRCNSTLSAGSLEIVISETAGAGGPKTGTVTTNYIELTNPIAMAADTWYNFNVPLTDAAITTTINAALGVSLYCNHATELDGKIIYLDDLKVTTGFTGGASDRWSHTLAHDTNEFTNNGGTALILSNNVDKPQYFEGDSSDVLAALDMTDFATFGYAKEIEEFRNHFFLMNYNNGSTHIRSLVFADLGDIDDYTTGTSGSTTLTDTRGKILRAKKLGSDMIIYSENTITTCRYIGGTTLFIFPTLVYETGLFAEKGIWDFVNIHYFIGTDQKIYGYSGGQQLIPIGMAIEDSFFNALNVANKDNIVIGIDTPKHKLCLFFPSSGDTYSSKAYVYNYKQTPTTWEYHEFNNTVRDFSLFSNIVGWYADGAELAGTYADVYILYADASSTQADQPVAVILSADGYIFKLNESGGKDYDNNISCTYETMDITYDGEESLFRAAWVSFNLMSTVISGTYDLAYSIDSGTSWIVVSNDSSISSGNANSWTHHRHPIDIVDRKVRFRLKQDSAKDIQIRAAHIKLKRETDRE